MQHNCIKCGEVYTDNDQEAYLCELCVIERNKIAKEVDKKMAGRISKNVKSALQIYDEIRQRNGGIVKIQDLGIKL